MKRGFTLIELLVSVGIFAVVMVIALGALLSISAGERKAETVKSVINNLDFALESMSRTIRTGVNFHCDTTNLSTLPITPQDCPDAVNGATYFAFLANDGTNVAYCVAGGSIWRTKINSGSLPGTVCGSNGFLQMTATEVKITGLTFYTKGAYAYPSTGSSACSSIPNPATSASGDCVQPRVTITITGYVNVGDSTSQQSAFNIQTTVAQRLYDQ